MDAFVEWWAQHMPLTPQLSVMLISMVPIIELRGGLFLAKILDVPMWEAVFFCAIGNILPIPFILFGAEKLLHWLADHHGAKLAKWISQKAERKRGAVDKYGFWGLALFVGIPLPGTGAWTGTLIAALFDMNPKKASLSIFIGLMLASTIMAILFYGFLGIFI